MSHLELVPDLDGTAPGTPIELANTAQLTLRLSCLLRDEDPLVTWLLLSRMSRRRLQELAVIALAAIPIEDFTLSELFEWVTDLPTAKERTA